MPGYRRRRGVFVFLTVVTACRTPLFAQTSARRLLRHAIRRTRVDRPWEMTAIVLLPDHLHMLWQMPADDLDYSTRIAGIKKRFTRAWLATGGREAPVAAGQRRHRLRGVWQRRFWKHTIRNTRDFRMHLDYIHGNPVKHGLVDHPQDWPWSSFGRYLAQGLYQEVWCGRVDLPGSVEYFWPE